MMMYRPKPNVTPANPLQIPRRYFFLPFLFQVSFSRIQSTLVLERVVCLFELGILCDVHGNVPDLGQVSVSPQRSRPLFEEHVLCRRLSLSRHKTS